jgi:hypothetical protein
MNQKKRIKNPKISSFKKIMKDEKEKRAKMGKEKQDGRKRTRRRMKG